MTVPFLTGEMSSVDLMVPFWRGLTMVFDISQSSKGYDCLDFDVLWTDSMLAVGKLQPSSLHFLQVQTNLLSPAH